VNGGRSRMALLLDRSRLELARQGQSLLEQKRDALLREFYREVPVVLASHAELERAAVAARLALEDAEVRLGPTAVAAAAATPPEDEIGVDLLPMSVLGLAVPAVAPRDLVRTPAGRGRDVPASGPALELAALRFEEELTITIRLATLEARVRRLAREIRRTRSRVNALRTRIIPRLEAETRAIELALEQREREDRFRLKRVKSRRR
jgi:V/A-type H+-transporting ATPase subunit D